MWRLILIAALIASPALAWCESAETPDPQLVVHRALLQLAKGAYGAEDQKQVRRLGDAAAVAFTKEIGNRPIKWTDIEHYLFLVHEAFASPELIDNQSDRIPRTSFFVLRTFSFLPLTDELKRSVVDARVFLEARAVAANAARKR